MQVGGSFSQTRRRFGMIPQTAGVSIAKSLSCSQVIVKQANSTSSSDHLFAEDTIFNKIFKNVCSLTLVNGYLHNLFYWIAPQLGVIQFIKIAEQQNTNLCKYR